MFKLKGRQQKRKAVSRTGERLRSTWLVDFPNWGVDLPNEVEDSSTWVVDFSNQGEDLQIEVEDVSSRGGDSWKRAVDLCCGEVEVPGMCDVMYYRRD